MGTEKSRLFSEEYSKLKNIELEIDNMKDQDIDKLNDLIIEAMSSAKFCEDRLLNIKKSLEDTITK